MKYENIREEELKNKVGADENSPSQRGLGGVELTPAYLQSHNNPTENLIFSKNFLPYNPKLKENSKALRKGGILSEVILWKELRADQFNGYSFYRQKPILNYIVDFYCKELNLVIEIDGFSHESDEAIQYYKERDRQMAVLGLRVLRVSDSEVKKNLQSVLSRIGDFTLPSHMETTPPDPLKEGEVTPPSPLREGEATPPDPS
jgi:very-short-patch-repair endonuclease